MRLAWMLLLLLGSSFGQLTDTALHVAPAPPALPGAGGKFTDPTFGTTVMQVTDPATWKYAFTVYSFYSAFNSDTTLILFDGRTAAAQDTVHWMVAEFDPNAFTLGATHELASLASTCGHDGIEWSYTQPKVFYCAGGKYISKVTVNVGWTFTVDHVCDLTSYNANLSSLTNSHLSRDDKRVSFDAIVFEGGNYNRKGTGVCDLQNRTVMYYSEDAPWPAAAPKTNLSKNGVWHQIDNDSAVTVQTFLHNVDTGVNKNYTYPGHSDTGSTFQVSFVECSVGGNSHLCVQKTDYATLQSTLLLDMGAWPNGERNISMFAGDDRAFVLMAFCTEGANCTNPVVDQPYEQEIFSVPTDGSAYPNGAGKIRRYVHTQGYPQYIAGASNSYPTGGMGYWVFSSHGVVSQDGRFVVFPSTWGQNDRSVLFVAQTEAVVAASSTRISGVKRRGVVIR